MKTIASRGEGVADVVAAIDKHRAWLDEHDGLHPPPAGRAPPTEIEAIALGEVRQRSPTCTGRRRWTQPRAGWSTATPTRSPRPRT